MSETLPERTTDVRTLNAVDHALDVFVPAAALEPHIAEALKAQRAQMTLKGFRPGKVPMGTVRKMVGPQVAVEVAERVIGEAYAEVVSESDAYDVIGQPRLRELDFDPTAAGADLRAVVMFGVRPEITLEDLSGLPVTRLVRTFTDDDVEADVQRRRDLAATEDDAPEGTALTREHTAIVDITPIDAEGERTGGTQRAARLVLANPELRPEMLAALEGKTVGETVRVELPHLHPEEGHGDDEETDPDEHTDRYDVTVSEVKLRTVPPLDADFVRAHTQGRTDSVDDLRAEARTELERSWNARSKQALEGKMVEAFVDAHRDAFLVPETLVETALDSMLDEARERFGGQLPPTFDADAFREQGRERAEVQVRWLLVKDALIRDEAIEITDDDFEAEFERLAGGSAEAEMVRMYLRSQPEMMDQMADHLLNERVFAALERRLNVVDKTREDLEAEATARRDA